MLFLSTVAWGQQDQRSHCSCWDHHCHPPQTWPERSSCGAHWWTPALTSGQASSSWLAIWSQTVFQSRVPVLLTAVSPVEHIVMNKVLNNPPLSLYPHLLWCSVFRINSDEDDEDEDDDEEMCWPVFQYKLIQTKHERAVCLQVCWSDPTLVKYLSFGLPCTDIGLCGGHQSILIYQNIDHLQLIYIGVRWEGTKGS